MSQLGLGCARLGSIAAASGRRSSIRLVHEAVDHGIGWFDTADAYTGGTSESLLGIALRHRRERVQIATKGGFVFADRGPLGRALRLASAPLLARFPRRHNAPAAAPSGPGGGARYDTQDFTPAHLTAALDASLRRLRTDHVDVYQLHGFGRSPRDVHENVVEAIDEWAESAIKSGKIGKLGLATESLEQASLVTRFRRAEALQLPFGLLDPEAGDELIPTAHRDGRHVTVRGVLGAGLLAAPPAPSEPKAARIARIQRLAAEFGVSAVQLALWYVADRPDVDIALVGTASRRHLHDVAGWYAAAPAPGSTLSAALGALSGSEGAI